MELIAAIQANTAITIGLIFGLAALGTAIGFGLLGLRDDGREVHSGSDEAAERRAGAAGNGEAQQITPRQIHVVYLWRAGSRHSGSYEFRTRVHPISSVDNQAPWAVGRAIPAERSH